MSKLEDLPQEILFDIFARNRDAHGLFAEKMKLVSKKCRSVVIKRGLDLVDVHIVQITVNTPENVDESDKGSIEAIVRFGDLQEKEGKSWTKTLQIENSSSAEVIKNMVDIILVNKVKSLKQLELCGVSITAELLDQIQHSRIDLKNVTTIVMSECQFDVGTEEFYNFLELCNLKIFEIKHGNFAPTLINEKLLRQAADRVSIGSKELIPNSQITNGLLNEWIKQPKAFVLHLELINMQTAIDLVAIIPVLEAIAIQPQDYQWSIGVFDFNTENELALLRLQRNFIWRTNIEDDSGMRKYTMNLQRTFREIRDCKIIFWMQTKQ